MQNGELPARTPKVLILCIGVNDLGSGQSVDETFDHVRTVATAIGPLFSLGIDREKRATKFGVDFIRNHWLPAEYRISGNLCTSVVSGICWSPY